MCDEPNSTLFSASVCFIVIPNFIFSGMFMWKHSQSMLVSDKCYDSWFSYYMRTSGCKYECMSDKIQGLDTIAI